MKRREGHEAREKGQRDERGGMTGAQNRVGEKEEGEHLLLDIHRAHVETTGGSGLLSHVVKVCWRDLPTPLVAECF